MFGSDGMVGLRARPRCGSCWTSGRGDARFFQLFAASLHRSVRLLSSIALQQAVFNRTLVQLVGLLLLLFHGFAQHVLAL